MGTSRRRTRPAPSPPGPEGARTAYRGKQKTSKWPFGFKWDTGNFCPTTNPWLPAPKHASSKLGKANGGQWKTSPGVPPDASLGR